MTQPSPGMIVSTFLGPAAVHVAVQGFDTDDGCRGHEIIAAYTLAFFDRYLKGRTSDLLDAPSVRYPEVTFRRRQRVRHCSKLHHAALVAFDFRQMEGETFPSSLAPGHRDQRRCAGRSIISLAARPTRLIS